MPADLARRVEVVDRAAAPASPPSSRPEARSSRPARRTPAPSPRPTAASSAPPPPQPHAPLHGEPAARGPGPAACRLRSRDSSTSSGKRVSITSEDCTVTRSPQSKGAMAEGPSRLGKAAVAAARPLVVHPLAPARRIVAADQVVERGAAQIARDLVRRHLRQRADHGGDHALPDLAVRARRRRPRDVDDGPLGRHHLDRPERALVERRLPDRTPTSPR